MWEKDGESRGGESSDGPDGGGHMELVGALGGHSKALLCLAVEFDLACSEFRIWRRVLSSGEGILVLVFFLLFIKY